MIAEVSFPIALNKTFYYLVPDRLKGKAAPGLRITAPFARRFGVLGYLLRLVEEKDADLSGLPNLKELSEIIDSEPVFPPEKLLEAASYMAGRWNSDLPMALGAFTEIMPFEKNSAQDPSPLSLPPVYLSGKIKSFLDAPGGGSALRTVDCGAAKTAETAEYAVSKGFFCLILVPDIPAALALKETFSGRASSKLCSLWHGKISKKNREEIWKAVRSLAKRIIIGAKSSVFLPFPEKTLIIMTDHSNEMYSQFDRKPHYNTRELILENARIFGYKVLLSGAPADPETVYRKEAGELEELDENKIPPVKLDIVDMRKEPGTVISSALDSVLKETFSRGLKAYVVASTRGFAPRAFCAKCYSVKRCLSCNSVMQVEEDEEGAKSYRCSYCSRKEEYSENCAKCGSALMIASGYGTQRAASQLAKLYPDKKIVKFDGDKVRKSYAVAEKAVGEILSGNFDILVGTSIILDGFLLKEPGAVAFAEFNPGRASDFRSGERAALALFKASSFTLADLTLVVQTHEPEAVPKSALADYKKFIADELELRKTFFYPPFALIVKLRFLSADTELLRKFSKEMVEFFSRPELKKSLEIMEYRPEDKMKFIKKEAKYSHSSIFKIKRGRHELFMGKLKNLSLPKKVEISVLTDL